MRRLKCEKETIILTNEDDGYRQQIEDLVLLISWQQCEA